MQNFKFSSNSYIFFPLCLMPSGGFIVKVFYKDTKLMRFKVYPNGTQFDFMNEDDLVRENSYINFRHPLHITGYSNHIYIDTINNEFKSFCSSVHDYLEIYNLIKDRPMKGTKP